ncbi:hypothetical protein UA08_04248 [Talaromyces atroroseus]|uniref:Zn(2)-C6 fungal-type domain-containing protein n=1 Tax=Talaromyces atroroseus TaxID=1441469 RepID=A0A1Q5Q9D4_TALAT|nr:hypothetical protein UA08_04248 [Talaromyces atroroseus]OKL60743.1 hypothetical protein UA08_04248 [Talaromyces atroroseus]
MTRPSPLACTECRKHHLKCDANKPSCSRCAEVQSRCVYVPSRRGARRKESNRYRHALTLTNAGGAREAQQSELPIGGHLNGNSSDQQGVEADRWVPDSRLVRLYYENHHPAHPILVPASFYAKRNYPQYLHQVVKFIGCQYSRLVPRDSLYEQTAAVLRNPEKTACMVQALLLYSSIMYARNVFSVADDAFSQAVDIALELGMYQRTFAQTYAAGKELEAESLRRTWWELYCLEVTMASLLQTTNLRCANVPHDVLLPCDESFYGSSPSTIPTPLTLASFRMRVFNGDDDLSPRYSVYTYRIEAISILARVVVLNSLPETHADHLQAVVNAIVSWSNHLPPDKVDVIDTHGNMDEMLFQAHTTIHYAAMLLHLPRGNLRLRFPAATPTLCPVTPYRLSPSFTRHVHDVKATESSKKMSNLLSVRSNVQGCSPFIVFALVLSGIVQITTAESHTPECAEHHHNRVMLVLGCLKQLIPSWPLAEEAYRYLQSVSKQKLILRAQNLSVDEDNTIPLQPVQVGSGPDISSPIVAEDSNNNTSIEMVDPRILSAYMDPTCSDSFLINQMFGYGELFT